MDRRKIIIRSIVAVVLSMVIAAYFVVSNMATEWLMTAGVKMLQDKLQTRVIVSDLKLRLIDGKVSLYGFEVDDRENIRMLKVDTLEVNADVFALLKKELMLKKLALHGADIVAYKNRKDSAANYQFVFDAFKKKGNEGTPQGKKNDIQLKLQQLSFRNISVSWDIKSEERKGGDTLDVNHLKGKVRNLTMRGIIDGSKVTDFALSKVNLIEEKSGMTFTMAEGQCRAIANRNFAAKLDMLRLTYQDKRVGLDHLSLWHNAMSIRPEISIKMDSLRYFCDNGKPRKNTGRPNRGAFDKGHMDAVMNVEAVLTTFNKDSLCGKLTRVWAKDKGCGLLVTNAKTDFVFITPSDTNNRKNKVIDFRNFELSMPKTHLIIDSARIRLEKNPKGVKPKTQVVIEPLHVSAHVGLQDISAPFAPPLSHFTTPLNLDVDVHGDLDRILFNNIRITSKGQQLRLTAEGDLCDVTKKQQLSLHFNNIHLSTHGGIKDKIIGHFRKKINLKMERQMKAIGDVDFAGRLTIVFKRELIVGTLMTKYGDVDVDFEINGFTKYLNGTMHGKRVYIGKVMNVDGLGPVSASAKYSFNIASKKKMRELGKNPGKLPIGSLEAKIEEVSFKKLSFHNISVRMKSNGSVAEGSVRTSMKLFDIQAEFMYKQTLHEQYWKLKPRLVRHLPSAKEIREKERKAEEKEAKRREKEARRQERRSIFSRIKEQINSLKKTE